MKQVSSALFLTNGYVFLGCHTTGGKNYDLPKGLIDNLESPVEACIRETREETGVEVKKEELIDLGVFSYNAQKNLHVFLCVKDTLPELDKMHCISMFTHRYTKKKLPEVDGYKYIPYRKRDMYLSKNLSATINQVITKIKELK